VERVLHVFPVLHSVDADLFGSALRRNWPFRFCTP